MPTENSPIRPQQLSAVVTSHKQQLGALLSERQQLLQAQAGLLRSYVMAGVPLPKGTSDAGASSAERRQQLVAQLTHEEGAARAALEALKQGLPLTKAREVGVSVMKQAQELAADSQGQVQFSAAGSSTPQPQCVLLAAGQGAAGSEQQQAGAAVAAAASGAAAAAGRQTRVAFSAKQQPTGQQLSASSRVISPPALFPAPDCGDDADMGADISSQQQRRRPASHTMLQQQHSASASEEPAPAYVKELQAQVAALQATLNSQLRPAPAAADPWSQLLPAMAAAAVFSGNPAAVAALTAAASGQQPGHAGLGQLAGLPSSAAGASAALGLPPDMLAADPSLAAAVSAHARDMALLRMDVEKVRAASELQQLKTQLAAAVQQQQQQQQQQVQQVSVPALPELYGNSSRRQTGVKQWQEQGNDGDLPFDAQPEQEQAHQQQADDEDVASLHHKLSDADGWLDGLAAGGDALLPAAAAAAAAEDEALAPEEASAVLAARGAVADTDVLQVHVATAGPFSRRGTYRVTAVMYEGYQPVEGAPGQQVSASTSKRLVAALGSGSSSSAAQGDADAAASGSSGVANFNEGLSLKGVSLSASSTLVFELHMAKPGLAGLPTKDALVGWTALPVLSNGQVVPGQQSLPLFRLPLMLTAQRKFTYDSALLDVRLAVYRGAPGDTDLGPGAAAAGPARPGAAVGQGQHEDIPGVPSAAWVQVQRSVPPADPYTPGDGLVVVVDASRFLPSSVTISRVLGSVWSSSGALLAGPFEGVAQPDSDALNPRYACSATLGVQHNNTRFEDATATLMLQVQTIERTSGMLRVVGFALLPLFLDPKAGAQPVSRSIQDYVLNQGAFQVPLHAGAPSSSGPLRGASLDDIPRLPCASLLLRVLTPEMAKLARRKPAPVYAERMYDTVSRATPTPLERVLYAKVLARRAMSVRSAARLVSWLRRQPGGLSGRVGSASRHITAGEGIAAGAAAGGSGSGSGGGGLLARVFGGGGDDEAAAAAAHLNTGDPAAAVELRTAELEVAQAEPLPPKDPEIIDWLSDVMEQAAAAATSARSKSGGISSSGSLSFINLNTGYEYSPSLGFFVALDGAARLARLLPTAGLVSYSPPGSLYQDHPLVDDVKVTLDYDMDAPLAAPRWLDGYQQFTGVQYHPSLVLLVDVRAVLPGSVSSSPQGWACLPVFEPAGCYVASGTYQLPLFQGIPSHQLLSELAASSDPDAVMRAAIVSGRVRPSLEASSVLVRLMCGSRQGQLEAPALSLPLPELRLPRYVVAELGPRFVAEMRKMIRNKTYSMAKPKDLTDEQFMDQINDTLIKVAGLDAQLEGGDSGDEGEGQAEGHQH